MKKKKKYDTCLLCADMPETFAAVGERERTRREAWCVCAVSFDAILLSVATAALICMYVYMQVPSETCSSPVVGLV